MMLYFSMYVGGHMHCHTSLHLELSNCALVMQGFAACVVVLAALIDIVIPTDHGAPTFRDNCNIVCTVAGCLAECGL